MRLLLEFLPWALFASALWLKDVYVATAVLMAAVCVQMAVIYALDKKLSLLQKVTLALILVFGALTLALHDERFIKWKPTVFSSAIALTLGIALWGLRKNLLRIVIGRQLPLPDPVWHRLTAAWVVYFLFMAALNGYVAAFWSTKAWAAFKLWGFVFPVLFIIGQGFYVAPHLQELPEPAPPPEET
jgi:intracellular septation protein